MYLQKEQETCSSYLPNCQGVQTCWKPPNKKSFRALELLGSCRDSIIQKSSWREEALVFPSANASCSQKDKMSSTPQGQKADLAEWLGPCSKELTASNSTLLPSAGNNRSQDWAIQAVQGQPCHLSLWTVKTSNVLKFCFMLWYVLIQKVCHIL